MLAVTVTRALPTPSGPARAHLHRAATPRAALVLGHGAATVLRLAFPVQPPVRARAGAPRPSRLLAAAAGRLDRALA